jgi:AAA+ ATPase superfamily predicted ATPase
MMLGMIVDSSEPLYGRAREILRLGPLPASYLHDVFKPDSPRQLIEHYAVWGGVPRYWELAAEYPTVWDAITELVLDPLGVLHQEPQRLLLDDFRETAQASSLLALIGQGCTRISELGGRLGCPSTSLTRPIARLTELGLLVRETPWDTDPRDSKKSLYQLADPFLNFWYRFVDPHRSRLALGQLPGVLAKIQEQWPGYLGKIWENLARASLSQDWLPAGRWWSKEVELDIVARHPDKPETILVGEAKISASPSEVPRLLQSLKQRAEKCPALNGCTLVPTLFVLEGSEGISGVISGQEVTSKNAEGQRCRER